MHTKIILFFFGRRNYCVRDWIKSLEVGVRQLSSADDISSNLDNI